MNNMIPTNRTLSLALAVTGLVFGASLAVAQQVTEEIIVRAPIERTDVRSISTSVAKVEIIELKRLVSIADLDLTKYADVNELDSRIDAIAKESCQHLSDMFPLDRSDPAEMKRCMKKAVASAKGQREEAIAAAN